MAAAEKEDAEMDSEGSSESALSVEIKPSATQGKDVDELDKSYQSIPAAAYQIKPSLRRKFKELPVKDIIKAVVQENLSGKVYDPENVKKWSVAIANDVNVKVKMLQMKRYRHIVQVIIGEKKGAGVKCGCRCIWDSDIDGYTSDVFYNETMFCVTTVFAVYLY